jgi:hypothetical protein
MMIAKRNKMIAAGLFVAAAVVGNPSPSGATEQVRAIPMLLRLQHEDTVQQALTLVDSPAPIGPEARKLLGLVQPYLAYQEQVVLPPLTLLPKIGATGNVTPDMEWALPMIAREQAERRQSTQAYEEIARQLVVLFSAADQANDAPARKVAQNITANIFGERELVEPTVAVMGDYMRDKLAAR